MNRRRLSCSNIPPICGRGQNGTLTPSSPTTADVYDSYTGDYTTTTGKKARWTAINWVHEYPNNSTYITEGSLRASHRALGQAPYDTLGLPYHNHFQSELKPIPAGEPVELVFDLLPTAYQIPKGNRIRLAIACANADNFDTPLLNPAPRLNVLRSASRPSYIDLPIVCPSPDSLKEEEAKDGIRPA